MSTPITYDSDDEPLSIEYKRVLDRKRTAGSATGCGNPSSPKRAKNAVSQDSDDTLSVCSTPTLCGSPPPQDIVATVYVGEDYIEKITGYQSEGILRSPNPENKDFYRARITHVSGNTTAIVYAEVIPGDFVIEVFNAVQAHIKNPFNEKLIAGNTFAHVANIIKPKLNSNRQLTPLELDNYTSLLCLLLCPAAYAVHNVNYKPLSPQQENTVLWIIAQETDDYIKNIENRIQECIGSPHLLLDIIEEVKAAFEQIITHLPSTLVEKILAHINNKINRVYDHLQLSHRTQQKKDEEENAEWLEDSLKNLGLTPKETKNNRTPAWKVCKNHPFGKGKVSPEKIPKLIVNMYIRCIQEITGTLKTLRTNDYTPSKFSLPPQRKLFEFCVEYWIDSKHKAMTQLQMQRALDRMLKLPEAERLWITIPNFPLRMYIVQQLRPHIYLASLLAFLWHFSTAVPDIMHCAEYETDDAEVNKEDSRTCIYETRNDDMAKDITLNMTSLLLSKESFQSPNRLKSNIITVISQAVEDLTDCLQNTCESESSAIARAEFYPSERNSAH